ncbi:E3 ubiquitin-protein ligase UPL5-like [Corylus avellana]|uniref:E3 ubiquitin-protein ligase UPL5-like n=1 Tax=Corylus avellana TaxID=13451 RepID=UPI00286C2B8B|nr:E3 ubiquitin-protein ligase UPL5-like [Corylus avellana]
MRKDEPNAVHSSSDAPSHAVTATNATTSQFNPRVPDARSASRACAAQAELTQSASRLQFFIRMISEGKTMVIQAYTDDTVRSVHERIQLQTGIPVHEQRLIYRGRQLQAERSLGECNIQNDAGLQLVGRMRSTEHPHAWQVINDIVSVVCRLCRGEPFPSAAKYIKVRMMEFLTVMPKDEEQVASGHLQIFLLSSAPAALVMLYMSPIKGNKDCADSSIRHFLNSSRNSLPKQYHNYCAPIVLEFCKLLRRAANEDPLYLSCRSTLGSLLESIGSPESSKGVIVMQEIFPFVSELASRLSKDLGLSMESPTGVGPQLGDVRDFAAFLLPLRTAITEQVGFRGPNPVSVGGTEPKHPLYGEEIEFLHLLFIDLLKRMGECLHKMEECLAVKHKGEGENIYTGWSQYLAILKELYSISQLYQGAEEEFWTVLRLGKSSLCALIVRYAKRTDDHQWLLERKDVTDSKVDPLHLDYFKFSGRVIALALMHKVQVGIVFDRAFFLQLAGKYISLEDIKDTDPCLYNSCKQILEMDSDFIDADALGLTFVREVEELGSRRVVELCQGGKSIVVNSKNREEYVRLLIEHRFVTSISEQVSHFAQGFGDILCNSRLQKFFFQSLVLEDLDWTLYGSETALCVDDWKAHTEFN